MGVHTSEPFFRGRNPQVMKIKEGIFVPSDLMNHLLSGGAVTLGTMQDLHKFVAFTGVNKHVVGSLLSNLSATFAHPIILQKKDGVYRGWFVSPYSDVNIRPISDFKS